MTWKMAISRGHLHQRMLKVHEENQAMSICGIHFDRFPPVPLFAHQSSTRENYLNHVRTKYSMEDLAAVIDTIPSYD